MAKEETHRNRKDHKMSASEAGKKGGEAAAKKQGKGHYSDKTGRTDERR